MTRHDATIPVRRAVRPFLDRASWRSIGLLTAASAVSGFAEAGALVVLTGIAVGVSRSSAQVDLGPLDLTMRSAILLCAGLLVVKLLLSTLTAWLGARLAAEHLRAADAADARRVLRGVLGRDVAGAPR